MIVEAMIAISVATVGLFGVMALLSRSISLNRVIANHYVANNLAAEGIEIVKYKIDSNYLSERVWNDELGPGSYGVEIRENNERPYEFSPISDCGGVNEMYFGEENGLYGYSTVGKPTTFRRCVTIEDIGDGIGLSVSSKVSWKDIAGSDFEVVVEDQFYNWR